MGADRGIRPLLKGLSDSLKKNGNLNYIIFGREDEISAAMKRFPELAKRAQIRHADDVVAMDDKPSQVMRRGKSTSMYAAIEAVKNNEANVAVSCGNTGALMALSMLILRKAPGIDRPAIAILWPSANPQGFNILLDAGADVRADAKDLHHYAVMGTSFARNLYGMEKPRLGILNVGTEEGKGRPELAEASELIEASKERININFLGFVEGSDISSNRVDVIVTDGFTGNIALKTGEGTARFVSGEVSKALKSGIFARIGSFIAYPAIRKMRKRLDPRRANGGVFLGLGGTVIKSHGSSDSIAFASAVKMAYTLGTQGFSEKLNNRLKMALNESETGKDD